MSDTMQLPTAASTDVPLRDQICRSARVARRQSEMKPVASNASARLGKGLALVLAVVAGIAAAPCSAAANETSQASRQTVAVAVSSSAVAAARQRIFAQPADHQTVNPDPSTRFVEKLYERLIRPTPR